MDEILTLKEVSAFLKVAEKTVSTLAQRGELPGFKVGGQWRFRRAMFEQWMVAQSVHVLSSDKHGDQVVSATSGVMITLNQTT